jgi:hypothetical protein
MTSALTRSGLWRIWVPGVGSIAKGSIAMEVIVMFAVATARGAATRELR